jgi:hypothetical protein
MFIWNSKLNTQHYTVVTGDLKINFGIKSLTVWCLNKFKIF